MTKALSRVGIAALLASVAVIGVAATPLVPAGASEPESQKVIIEPTPGTYTFTWTGVIPPGATAAKSYADDSPCIGEQDVESDVHTLNFELGSSRVYKLNNVAFTFSIRWSDPDQDSAINVLGPAGGSVGFGDSAGATNIESVKLNNLDEGPYKVLACGFSRFLPEEYVGTLEVVVTPRPQPKPKTTTTLPDASATSSGSSSTGSGSAAGTSGGGSSSPSSFNPAPATRVNVSPASRSVLPAAGAGRVGEIGALPEESSAAAPPAFIGGASSTRTFTPDANTVAAADFNEDDSATKIPLPGALLAVIIGVAGCFFALLVRRRRGLDGTPSTAVVPVTSG